jgi:molecular chaperone DnaK
MHVSAKDLGTDKEQRMTVTGGSALSKDEIDRMVRDAEQYAQDDHKRREAAETRNQAEQLVYQTEQLLRDHQDKIPADAKDEVESALADVKEKLKGEDTAAIRSATENAATVSQKLGQAMYAQASPSAASGSASGEEGAAGAEPGEAGEGEAGEGQARAGEDVVDAEIVDEDEDEDRESGSGGRAA